MRRNDSRILIIGTAVVFEERLNGELAALLYSLQYQTDARLRFLVLFSFWDSIQMTDTEGKGWGGGIRDFELK